MDTQMLIDSLSGFTPREMLWKFALYSAVKSRDGIELNFYPCQMSRMSGWALILKNILLEKTTAEKTVMDYSPLIGGKENIAALEATSAVIRGQLKSIISDIKKGEFLSPDEILLSVPKPTGYVFFGERAGNNEKPEQVLIMRRGNPFLSGQKARICDFEDESFMENEKAVIKLTPAVDFIYIGGVCYFISAAIEKDFDLENRDFAYADRCLKIIAEAAVLSDFDSFTESVMTSKNAKKFARFDSRLLEHIARLSILSREEFLGTYGINIDSEGLMDCAEAEQRELIIDLLCRRSIIDPLGRLSVVSGMSARE